MKDMITTGYAVNRLEKSRWELTLNGRRIDEFVRRKDAINYAVYLVKEQIAYAERRAHRQKTMRLQEMYR